jgi:hypothetical protein
MISESIKDPLALAQKLNFSAGRRTQDLFIIMITFTHEISTLTLIDDLLRGLF